MAKDGIKVGRKAKNSVVHSALRGVYWILVLALFCGVALICFEVFKVVYSNTQ